MQLFGMWRVILIRPRGMLTTQLRMPGQWQIKDDRPSRNLLVDVADPMGNTPYFYVYVSHSEAHGMRLNGDWRPEFEQIVAENSTTEISISWDPSIHKDAPSGVADITFVKLIPQLDSFRIYCGIPIDLKPLSEITQLKTLEIECPKLRAPFAIDKLTALRKLHIVWHRHLLPLIHLSDLQSLSIQNYPFTSFAEIAHMKNLENLEIIGSRKLLSLNGLSSLPKLKKLFIDRSPNLADISAIEDIPFSGDVTFESCKLVSAMGF